MTKHSAQRINRLKQSIMSVVNSPDFPKEGMSLSGLMEILPDEFNEDRLSDLFGADCGQVIIERKRLEGE